MLIKTSNIAKDVAGSFTVTGGNTTNIVATFKRNGFFTTATFSPFHQTLS